jgi:DNA-binding PadR family transcriptional regulator
MFEAHEGRRTRGQGNGRFGPEGHEGRHGHDGHEGHGGHLAGGRGGGRGFGGGPGGGRGGRGGRMRRGDIRTAVLVVLSEQDGHGYEVIQALEAKTGGAWRPSPGSVYPTLQMLEDTGLAQSSERDGKRVYSITEAGRAEAQKRLDEAGGPPWADAERGGGLRGALMQLAAAARQVGVAGNEQQVGQAVAIVTDARKQLYRLLADD